LGGNRQLRLVRIGGFILCLLLGIQAELENVTGLNPQPLLFSLPALALTVLAGLLFLRITRDIPPPPRWPRNLLLLLLGLSAFLAFDLAIIDALVVPLVVPKPQRTRWFAAVVGVMTVSLGLYLWTRVRGVPLPAGLNWQDVALSLGAAYLETIAWCALAFFAACLIVQIEEDRRNLMSLNAALTSSRVLLAETARVSERLDIARELHDSLGHHLTTLNLELEIANHCVPEERPGQIQRAQFLARLLLAELRDTVTSWRRELTGGLPEALQCLVAGVGGVKVHLRVDPELPALDPARAHSLLRCAQEGLTNVLRHAAASEVWISLTHENGAVVLAVQDNGPRRGPIEPGSGLHGVSERARQHGGEARFSTQASGGFEMRVSVPLTAGAAA
jgi:signal transduction histidine kinase